MADSATGTTESKLSESDAGEEKTTSSAVEIELYTSGQNEDETTECEGKSIQHDTRVEADNADLAQVHADESRTKEAPKTKMDAVEVGSKTEVKAKESDTISKQADVKEIKENETVAKEVEEQIDNKVVTSESDSREVAKEMSPEEVTTSSGTDTEDTRGKLEVGADRAKVNEQDDGEDNAISDSKLTESNIKETAVTYAELNVSEPNDVGDNRELNPEVAAAEQGALDILNLPGTDDAKFQKLSELMSAGEMSSKDFVNSVLSLVCSILFIYVYLIYSFIHSFRPFL